MSILRGVQRSAAPSAADRERLPLPPSWLAALRSRFSSSFSNPTPPREHDIICGGIVDAPGREMNPNAIELARFAVAEHNSKTNAALEFVRLVKVRTQVVAGTMNYFTVEVREADGGANKLYEAKVWLRPWENFKGLHAFEPVEKPPKGKTKICTGFSHFDLFS